MPILPFETGALLQYRADVMKSWLALLLGFGVIGVVGCGGSSGQKADGFSAASTSISFTKGSVVKQEDGSYLVSLNVRNRTFEGAPALGDEIAVRQFEFEFDQRFGSKPALVGLHVTDGSGEKTRMFHLSEPHASSDSATFTFRAEPHVPATTGPLSDSETVAPREESGLTGRLELDTNVPSNVYGVYYWFDTAGNKPKGIISFDEPTTVTFDGAAVEPYSPSTSAGAAEGAFATVVNQTSPLTGVKTAGRINGNFVEQEHNLTTFGETGSFSAP
jgi:hypothetical protein